MQLDLNQEERKVLSEILNETLPNLREEVYKTENYDYREQLEQRESVVRELLSRLAVSRRLSAARCGHVAAPAT